jgi:hypothetical protein
MYKVPITHLRPFYMPPLVHSNTLACECYECVIAMRYMKYTNYTVFIVHLSILWDKCIGTM